MELKGKVVQKIPLVSGVTKAGKEWKKSSLIVETQGGDFPRKVYVSNFKSAEDFDQIPLNAEITMEVDVESREFNGKWYTSVTCFRYDITPSAPTDADGHEMTNEQINENIAKMYGAEQAQAQKPQVQAQPQQAEDLPF